MRHTRVVVAHYGGPEVITTIEEDVPTPKAGEVRVKVLAAGVSLPDVLAREGVHPETPRVPYTPGWDLVGTVDQLGEAVSGFEPRQTVAAMPIHGCYAQYACVPSRKLVPVPVGLDPAEAVVHPWLKMFFSRPDTPRRNRRNSTPPSTPAPPLS